MANVGEGLLALLGGALPGFVQGRQQAIQQKQAGDERRRQIEKEQSELLKQQEKEQALEQFYQKLVTASSLDPDAPGSQYQTLFSEMAPLAAKAGLDQRTATSILTRAMKDKQPEEVMFTATPAMKEVLGFPEKVSEKTYLEGLQELRLRQARPTITKPQKPKNPEDVRKDKINELKSLQTLANGMVNEFTKKPVPGREQDYELVLKQIRALQQEIFSQETGDEIKGGNKINSKADVPEKEDFSF